MSVDAVETDSHQPEKSWLAESIRLAVDSVDSGGGPFGALIVREGEVVATGTNLVTTSFDPTAHAEVTAIRRACERLRVFALDGCVLVSSCEPCPMCLSAVLWSRVDRVIYAADRDDAAGAGFDDRAFYDLFSDPAAVWPTPVTRVDVPERNAAFDAWCRKPDRVEY
ncbi:nucleoside deaminase [Parasphingorhabdus pacifica]